MSLNQVLWTIMPLLLLTLGATGNVLGVLVLLRGSFRRRHGVIHLIALSVVDLLALFTSSLLESWAHNALQVQINYGPRYCEALKMLNALARALSTYIILFLAVERLIEVWSPTCFSRKRYRRLILCILLVLCVLLTSYHVFFLLKPSLTRHKNNPGGTRKQRQESGVDDYKRKNRVGRSLPFHWPVKKSGLALQKSEIRVLNNKGGYQTREKYQLVFQPIVSTQGLNSHNVLSNRETISTFSYERLFFNKTISTSTGQHSVVRKPWELQLNNIQETISRQLSFYLNEDRAEKLFTQLDKFRTVNEYQPHLETRKRTTTPLRTGTKQTETFINHVKQPWLLLRARRQSGVQNSPVLPSPKLNNTKLVSRRRKRGSSEDLDLLFLDMVLLTVIPLLAIVTCNLFIVYKIIFITRWSFVLQSSADSNFMRVAGEGRRKLSKMTRLSFVLSILQTISILPLAIVQVLPDNHNYNNIDIYMDESLVDTGRQTAWTVASLVLYTRCAVDIFLFSLLGKLFRSELILLLKCSCRRPLCRVRPFGLGSNKNRVTVSSSPSSVTFTKSPSLSIYSSDPPMVNCPDNRLAFTTVHQIEWTRVRMPHMPHMIQASQSSNEILNEFKSRSSHSGFRRDSRLFLYTNGLSRMEILSTIPEMSHTVSMQSRSIRQSRKSSASSTNFLKVQGASNRDRFTDTDSHLPEIPELTLTSLGSSEDSSTSSKR